MSSPVLGAPSPTPEPPHLQSTGEFLRNVAILIAVPLLVIVACVVVLRWLGRF